MCSLSQGLISKEPFIDAFDRFGQLRKQIEFLEKMSRDVLHPHFDPLKVTGRTSSSGDLNSQNPPRDDRIRGCFIPSAGHVYIDADYHIVELATLAQACLRQFNLTSQMAETLNAGQDPHKIVAARVAGKPLEAITKEERQRAKAINLGKPGGMGDKALQEYARDSYRVELSDDGIRALSEAWFDLFPEMRDFLQEPESDTGWAVATAFGLSAWSYFEFTGSQRFLRHVEAQQTAESSNPALGGMLLKAVSELSPATGAGRSYEPRELEYFWGRLQAHAQWLPSRFRGSIEHPPQLRR